tara:strand:+ start:880 stop:1221 length:342 start_codon:yes stop_codon:yes gene_type:complete
MSKILNTEESNGLVIISTQGYLNKDLGEEIQSLANNYIDKGNTKFLINLSQSNIVNSIGASIMIELIETLQEIDGDLSFCELAPIIEKTFNIMGLTKYCKTFKSQSEAIEALG